MTRLSSRAARVAIGSAVTALLLLASLHVLSPEFDPSWRVVSEYANGRYGWLLSLMFAAWGLSSWALLVALSAEARTIPFKIGLVCLALAGLGQAMAAVFDINHDTLHGLAGALGILGLPIAAMLISVSLARAEPWSVARRPLLWTANLTWVSMVALAATLVLLMATFIQVSGSLPAQAPKALPAGVVGLVGLANRLLVGLYCAWVITVAWHAIVLHKPKQAGLRARAPRGAVEI